MSQPWAAEQEISAELAATRIAQQFPQLAPVRLRLLGTGWDNTAFLVNDTHVFRFPRRQIAVAILEIENRILPALAGRLPLAVPLPLFLGRSDERFPWPFAGYRMLPGRTACAAGLSDAQRVAAASPIAHFLKTLHAVPRAEAEAMGAGPDAFGRFDFAKSLPRVQERLKEGIRLGLIDDMEPWRSIMERATRVAMPPANTLVHGDLYFRHLLVDDGARPCGVIDWGDVHLGQRSLDLALVAGFLPPAGREIFHKVYGDVDDATWSLARYRALEVSAILIAYGRDRGDADLVRESLASLRNLAEP